MNSPTTNNHSGLFALLLALVGTIAIALFGFWNANKSNTTPPTDEQAQLSIMDTEPREASELENKIPTINTPTLPQDIHPSQVVKTTSEKFALVVRPSLNVVIPDLPQDFEPTFVGVIEWDDAKRTWKKFLDISDTDTAISKSNNPIAFEFVGLADTDQTPYLTVVGTNGAGSGEGVAKQFRATSLDLTQWELVDCYNYAYDLGKGTQIELRSPECSAVSIELVIE